MKNVFEKKIMNKLDILLKKPWNSVWATCIYPWKFNHSRNYSKAAFNLISFVFKIGVTFMRLIWATFLTQSPIALVFYHHEKLHRRKIKVLLCNKTFIYCMAIKTKASLFSPKTATTWISRSFSLLNKKPYVKIQIIIIIL